MRAPGYLQLHCAIVVYHNRLTPIPMSGNYLDTLAPLNTHYPNPAYTKPKEKKEIPILAHEFRLPIGPNNSDYSSV